MTTTAAAPGRIRIPAVAGHLPAGGRGHLLSIPDRSPEDARYLCRRALRIEHAPADPQKRHGGVVEGCGVGGVDDEG